MRRQRYINNDMTSSNDEVEDFIQMEGRGQQVPHRFENTIEAKVEEGDTLQALALKFHCTVADIKRLNKIDKDNEIYARKVVKIPVTVHNVLISSLPIVHKSSNNSPNRSPKEKHKENDDSDTRNVLEEAETKLNEKLLVASVNSAGDVNGVNINSIVMKSKTKGIVYTDEDTSTAGGGQSLITSPLLDDIEDEIGMVHLRPIRGPSLSAIDWSGSDCDISWVCLFVIILGLCFVIPLMYVIYFAEHSHHHNSTTH